MRDIQGEVIAKKLAAQQLNNVGVYISSYLCNLNSEEQIKQVRYANSVVAAYTAG